jgi:hypothetical protein
MIDPVIPPNVDRAEAVEAAIERKQDHQVKHQSLNRRFLGPTVRSRVQSKAECRMVI